MKDPDFQENFENVTVFRALISKQVSKKAKFLKF